MTDGWIQTFTGRRFYPLAPRASDVDVCDIAHALAMKCRFTGHCRPFYSVAQHSVCVGRWVDGAGLNPRMGMIGLLHDAAEAYLPDVARPIKPLWPGFAEREAAVLAAVHEALGVALPDEAERAAIKEADGLMMATEGAKFFPAELWRGWDVPHSAETWFVIEPMSPQAAELEFLREYVRLSDALPPEAIR